ncbi:MAG TPA: hypothetical protein VFG12_06940 [Rhodopila sp.]|nr:hypothetical protein [Rhodopila sp.]
MEFRLPVRMASENRAGEPNITAREQADARGILFNEHLIYPWPRRTRDVFFEEIPKLPPGISEIFLHPALDGEELRACDPANADIRVHDAACLIDPLLTELLDQFGIRRIGFHALRDLQRAV